jgi:hypothetical protein
MCTGIDVWAQTLWGNRSFAELVVVFENRSCRWDRRKSIEDKEGNKLEKEGGGSKVYGR